MKSTNDAFTRIELLASAAALALVVAIASPMLAGSKSDAQRAGCFNNLRQIGRAAQLWANDHNELFPWLTAPADGGTQVFPKTGVAWAEFITLSNELASPRILACPSDSATKVASHWANTANGFANSAFRGNALSYFLSYHSEMDRSRSVVTGDRDFKPTDPTPISCSRGPINVISVIGLANPTSVWTNLVHPGAGHLLTSDGGVEYVGSAALQRHFVGPEQSDNGSVHYINPR